MARLPAIPKLPCVSGIRFHRKIANEITSTENPFKDFTVKKMTYMLIMAMATPLLSGCFGKGSSADPPANFSATAGDGRVMLTWTPTPWVDYWIFSATDPSLTAFNWANLPNAHGYTYVSTPFYICGLFNGTQYYFAANGRTNGGPGGTSSPTISAIPYNASTVAWTSGSTTPTTTSAILGVGYTSLTTCSNNPISASGDFAAVGAGGTVFTSSDGMTWTAATSEPTGLPDLYAVTGYAASQNNPSNPGLRWVAVGDGGTAIYSTDGNNWSAGSTATANPSNYPLRSITQVNGNFFAVGDAGTIISSTDGNTWYSHTSGTPNKLNGVTHGNYFVAVGDSGTILISSDGNTWVLRTSITPDISSINLKQVAYYGNIIVAVGDSGTIATSIDNGATWTSQTQGTLGLVGIAAETQLIINAVPDTQLKYISTVQFVAVDSAGDTYTSQNGIDWSPGNNTGIASATNSLVSSGFGYVAVGSGGATAYAF
jgi:photosystem II stability/assembly factor-like uncharacterized protein